MPRRSDPPASSAGTSAPLPDPHEAVDYIRELRKPLVVDVLRRAVAQGRPALQARSGVGQHEAMKSLLAQMEREAQPSVLTLTIDSHTRLKRFDEAFRAVNVHPDCLNGYPLVAHGWRRGRELNEATAAPLQVRHGSPDARTLFAVSLAAGITSFEGGGISYNLPYSKDVPLSESLAAWREVDRTCGELASRGLIIDRELFGTLTAVLVPPSISLAVSFLEAVAATREGVRCISVAYPQGGHPVQDVAALRSVSALAARYLPEDVEVHAVLHEFMGVFPTDLERARSLIFYGALVGRLANASKVITKTYQEAHGIPDIAANVDGINTARLALSELFDFVTLDEEALAEESHWIQREVAELVDPLLEAPDLHRAICDAFSSGRLDIPFGASRHTNSAVIPQRDATGAIRYLSTGSLPFSREVLRRNQRLVGVLTDPRAFFDSLIRDIYYFDRSSAEPAFSGARSSVVSVR